MEPMRQVHKSRSLKKDEWYFQVFLQNLNLI